MSARVRFSSRAEIDISDGIDWYQKQKHGLGLRFINDLELTIGRVSANPVRFPISYSLFRRALLKKFPYAIYFPLDEQEVRIAAVLHYSRDIEILESR